MPPLSFCSATETKLLNFSINCYLHPLVTSINCYLHSLVTSINCYLLHQLPYTLYFVISILTFSVTGRKDFRIFWVFLPFHFVFFLFHHASLYIQPYLCFNSSGRLSNLASFIRRYGPTFFRSIYLNELTSSIILFLLFCLTPNSKFT